MLATLIDTFPSGLNAKRKIKALQQRLPGDYHTVELDTCYIRYRMAGSGKHTLVLATDPPISLECYDELIGILAKDYRVIVFELPGFGYSLPKIGFDFRFDNTIEILIQLLKHWNCGPYVLSFPCAAAYFSIALAERFPQWVSHLALIQAPNWQQEQLWKHRLDPKSILNTPIMGQVFLKLGKRKVARQWVEYASNTPPFTQHSQALIDKQLHHGGCYCLASAMQKSLTPESPALSGFTQPAIMVYGQQDSSHKKTDFETIRDYNPSIETCAIDKAGHFPELETPQLFKNYLDKLIYASN
ncbi:hypothetical protein R50073_48260 [Maricurvus nonylphenolicus]|uniref:alpha/beta fold hydrolase n=1 Tax=Maricurvus nonylphenolicus TaxID=1008307 RepID=UPI0036F28E41